MSAGRSGGPEGSASLVPRWIRWLLRATAGRRADEVEGDLVELCDAWAETQPRWIAKLRTSFEALRIAGGFALYRLARRDYSRVWSVLDLRLAVRLMIRQPVLTVTAVLALATTMSMTLVAWTVASDAVWGRLDTSAPSELFVVRVLTPDQPFGRGASDDEIRRFRQSQAVEAVSGFRLAQSNLARSTDAVPVVVRSASVDGDAFAAIGVTPGLGRFIDPSDLRLERDVAVLSHQIWERRFDGDSAVVGSSVLIDGVPHQVIGVAGPGFRFPVNEDVWIPLERPADGEPITGLRVFGRRHPGASLDEVDRELTGVLVVDVGAAQARVSAVPYAQGFMSPGSDLMIWAMVAALIGLAAIAAANIASVVSARTEARSGEIAVRAALGASRARIVGQLFLEVAVLAAVACALAIGVTVFALGWMALRITEVPFWITFDLEPNGAAFALALASGVAVIAGLFPALRSTGRHMGGRLKTRGFSGQGLLGRTVMVAEIALTVGLLSGALAVSRGLLGFGGDDYGLPLDQVLTATLVLPGGTDANRSAEDARVFRESLRQALLREPLVRSVGFSDGLPLEGAPRQTAIEVDDISATVSVAVLRADPDFYELLDVSASAGPEIRTALADPDGVLVSEPFVTSVLGGRNVIGRRVRTATGDDDDAAWMRIVGVVPDMGLAPGDRANAPAIHLPMDRMSRLRISIRSDGDVAALGRTLRQAVMREDARVRVERVRTLRDAGADSRALLQTLGAGLLGLGVIALLLSVAGLYAVLAHSVARRVREIGLRVALGANSAAVVGSVLSHVLRHLAIGLGLGGLLAVGVLSSLATLPVAVPNSLALNISIPALCLALATLAAGVGPTLRAVRIQPGEALKSE